jgi:hypothetical protein
MPQHLKPKQRLHRHLKHQHLHPQLKRWHPLTTQATTVVVAAVMVVDVDVVAHKGKHLRNQ